MGFREEKQKRTEYYFRYIYKKKVVNLDKVKARLYDSSLQLMDFSYRVELVLGLILNAHVNELEGLVLLKDLLDNYSDTESKVDLLIAIEKIKNFDSENNTYFIKQLGVLDNGK